MGVNPRAREVMTEAGVDISEQRSKDLDGVPLERIDTLEVRRPWDFFRVRFFFTLGTMTVLGASLSRFAWGDYDFLLGVAILDLSMVHVILGIRAAPSPPRRGFPRSHGPPEGTRNDEWLGIGRRARLGATCRARSWRRGRRDGRWTGCTREFWSHSEKGPR